jgi:PPOX class probable F420-dependent enzyme
MIPAHHREFVTANRLCVLSWNRSSGGGGEAPPQTPVFYVTEGDDILVSITEDRAKTRALRRDPAISVCVLGEEMPYPYVTVFGTAAIETGVDHATQVMSRVIAAMGRPLDDEGLRKLRERAEEEQRVVLRVTPQRTVSNIPAPK